MPLITFQLGLTRTRVPSSRSSSPRAQRYRFLGWLQRAAVQAAPGLCSVGSGRRGGRGIAGVGVAVGGEIADGRCHWVGRVVGGRGLSGGRGVLVPAHLPRQAVGSSAAAKNRHAVPSCQQHPGTPACCSGGDAQRALARVASQNSFLMRRLLLLGSAKKNSSAKPLRPQPSPARNKR